MTFPKDNPAALNAFYGDPGSGETAKRLVPVIPPFKFTYEGKPFSRFMVHEKCAAAFKRALDKIWDYYGHDQAAVDRLHISRTAGTFNVRKIAGSDRYSNHSYGAAVDINSEENGFNTGQGTMPKPVVAAFKSEGFAWGGDYKGRTDPMHFEAVDRGEPVRTFAEWLAFYNCPPAAIASPEPTPPVVVVPPVPASTPAPKMLSLRERMARTIVAYEARRDALGHLAIYTATDGSREIAGVNETSHPAESKRLQDLIRAGQFAEAEAAARNFIIQYTNPVSAWTADAGVEFYLRDCYFNRGPGGAARILQTALHVTVDGQVGSATRQRAAAADPAELLLELRAAREAYEIATYGKRSLLWEGLTNRWNNSLAAAQAFQREAGSSVAGPVIAGAGAVVVGTGTVIVANSDHEAATTVKQSIGWGGLVVVGLMAAIILLVAINIIRKKRS